MIGDNNDEPAARGGKAILLLACQQEGIIGFGNIHQGIALIRAVGLRGVGHIVLRIWHFSP